MYQFTRRSLRNGFRKVTVQRNFAGTAPPHFSCNEHGHDLTDQVRDQLSHPPTPVVGLSIRSKMPSPAQDEPFLLIVTCPGKEGSSHELQCEGKYWQTEHEVRQSAPRAIPA